MKNILPILVALASTALPAIVRGQEGPVLPVVAAPNAGEAGTVALPQSSSSQPTTEPIRLFPPTTPLAVSPATPDGPSSTASPSPRAAANSEAGGVLNVDESAKPLPQPSPTELVEQTAQMLTRRYSIAAKIRHRADVNGHEMIGVGEYWQGPASSRLMRYELRLQVGRRIVEQLQVNDGRYLWRSTKFEKEPDVERIDVDRTLAAALAAGTNGPDLINVLGMGGLGRLLESLRKDFEFTEVFRSQLDGLPVYGVVGRWKPAVYATFGAASPDKLRKHIPDQVTLYLGCDDAFLYRIDFQRTSGSSVQGGAEQAGAGQGGAAPGGVGTVRPLLKMELFEVRFDAPLDEGLFRFEPGKKLFVDATDRFIGTRNNTP